MLTVSERLARSGADALTVEEHLAFLVGGEILAAQMLKYFGSILALSRASLCELRKFLPKRKAESLIAALRVSAYGQAQQALSEPLNRPEMVYSACLDMHMFNQEVLRVLLLNARFRLITSSDVCKGTLNESAPTLAKSFAQLSSIRPMLWFLYTTIHQAIRRLPKPTCGSPAEF
jgi:DNA repair protein RadC